MVTTNKNAYEIRTDVLSMAQGLVMEKFHNAYSKWTDSTDRHPQTGAILSTTDSPEYPTSADILKEAKQLYSFVNSN